MAKDGFDAPRAAYLATAALLGLAFLFPVALMVFDPTLMFERGWEQYVGTGIYFWAVTTLAIELRRLWREERAFEEAPALRKYLEARLDGEEAGASAGRFAADGRTLPSRVRQLAGFAREARSAPAEQLMEVNREASGLDQEQCAGRFTLTRYILYLLPVIGFIGTVEGISKALMKISQVLPMVKDLDAFLGNLTGVTSALQIAFDSTLLALFLGAWLMLAQTLVFRLAERQLARVDRWVVEHVLPGIGSRDPMSARIDDLIAPHVERLRSELATILEPAALALRGEAEKIGVSLRGPVEQLATAVDRLPGSLSSFRDGADAIARVGQDFEALGAFGESSRRAAASLARIEEAMDRGDEPDPQLHEIKRALDRNTAAVEGMASAWASAYEKSSRTTQEQLAKTMSNLKDALDLINVSIEQANSLYRNIVKRMFDERSRGGDTRAA
ncbi:MotA/TolQ/ExbB proton channel family protein [Paludisphaera sp.]|uniref:MotA/TolQ/ExbB proton channel family protein n=1 Tax=Paludisphaera sp. TaxID=2017432 RepID=UPI00301E3A92